MKYTEDKKFLPYRATHNDRREHWHFWWLGLASIWEGLVITLSLGYLTVDTRAWVIFDLWDQD